MFEPGRTSTLVRYLRAVFNCRPLTSIQEHKALAGVALSKSNSPQVRRSAFQGATAIIKAHLALVVTIAEKYEGQGKGLFDLIDHGNQGLLRAMGRFDPERRCRFASYATWWVRQSIRRSLVKAGAGEPLPRFSIELLDSWPNHEFFLGGAANGVFGFPPLTGAIYTMLIIDENRPPSAAI